MAKRIFVTATNTDIGKTYTSKRLIETFTKMGFRVGVYKPIETGVETLPMDANSLYELAKSYNPALESLGASSAISLTFPLPAAPYVANQGRPIPISLFEDAIRSLERLCDIVIIEGAGGLLVPIDAKTMMIDLPAQLCAVTLLVTHCRLGCINDTLLNLRLLDSLGLPYVWAYNCRENDHSFTQTSLPYFNAAFESVYSIQDDMETIAQRLLDTIPNE